MELKFSQHSECTPIHTDWAVPARYASNVSSVLFHTVKHNVLSVLARAGTHVELVLGDTPESDT